MRIIFFDFLIVSVLKKCYTKKKFVVLIVIMKKLVNLIKIPFFKIFITFGASPVMCQCIICGDGLLSIV